MTETLPSILRCAFTPNGSTYDYLADFAATKGDLVIVDTNRGEQVVRVEEVVEFSEKATAYALRPANAEEKGRTDHSW